MNSNIYLIGMMGAGKSTIGRLLSKKLKKEYIDTDNKIERFTQLTIQEIFEEFGENRFREMEESYFVEKSQATGLIISTGGGIILSSKNRKILKSSKNTIYLKAQPEILVERVYKKRHKRPILKNDKSILDKLTEIYNKRNKLYEASASHIIITDQLTKIEKLNKVLACLD